MICARSDGSLSTPPPTSSSRGKRLEQYSDRREEARFLSRRHLESEISEGLQMGPFDREGKYVSILTKAHAHSRSFLFS